ncbi:MAG: hypothetical protein IKJ79_05835 [Bacteroidaceae bacterium]|nr:hypothetical protein [Bacteroidaceae bacterium]
MKRILITLCVIASSMTLLQAQESISETSKTNYMTNVSYNKGYRADVELSIAIANQLGISTSHGYSFGNGLYVGGGAGFVAEYLPNFDAKPSFLTPVFADIKYSFIKDCIASPFVAFKGGAMADITNKGIRIFANPAVGIDIARFSLKIQYEYQQSVWGYNDAIKAHYLKIGVGYTF